MLSFGVFLVVVARRRLRQGGRIVRFGRQCRRGLQHKGDRVEEVVRYSKQQIVMVLICTQQRSLAVLRRCVLYTARRPLRATLAAVKVLCDSVWQLGMGLELFRLYGTVLEHDCSILYRLFLFCSIWCT